MTVHVVQREATYGGDIIGIYADRDTALEAARRFCLRERLPAIIAPHEIEHGDTCMCIDCLPNPKPPPDDPKSCA